MVLRGLVLWYPLTPSRYGSIMSLYGCILSLDSGAKGMVLRGLALLCPLPPPLPILLFSPALTGVWSYVAGHCCAPSLPIDTAVISRFDVKVEDMVIWGLVLLCHLLPA